MITSHFKTIFPAILLATQSGCAHSNASDLNAAQIASQFPSDSALSPRYVIENRDALVGKEMLIDGFLHEACEIMGSRDCIASGRNRRFTIFGGSNVHEAALEACRSGGSEELLIVSPLPQKLAQPRFRRVLLKARLVPHRETLPRDFRGSDHATMVTDYEFALTDVEILSVSDTGCEEVPTAK